MSFVGTAITPSRILSLAETRAPHEVAAVLKIDEEEVLEVLHRAGKVKASWTFRCNKTGRQWRARSERGAYRMAHLMGLTDWDCWQGDPIVEIGATKVTKIAPGEERDAVIRQLREGGQTIAAIARAVGTCPKTIRGALQRLGLATQ